MTNISQGKGEYFLVKISLIEQNKTIKQLSKILHIEH